MSTMNNGRTNSLLFGIVILALAQGMRFGVGAWEVRGRRADTAAELDAADRLIRTLIERASPGSEQNPARFRGTAHAMALRSELPLSAGSQAERRIEAVLELDGENRLVLRWVPYLHAQRLAAPPPAQTAILAHEAARIEFQYWGSPAEGKPAAWFREWRGPGPPALVRVRLVFRPGSGRIWPAIVAAPRDRALEE